MKKNPSERGQTLVLIALALIAIFGFAALAIDGGRLYSERRRAQNAADAAAYAAASASVDGEAWDTAGLKQAEINGYLDAYPTADPTQYMDVMVFNPPIDGPYSVASSSVIPTEYYQVKIRTRVDQAFSQIVFPKGLEIAVEAVAHALPDGPISAGDAIVAMCPDCCQDIKVHDGNDPKVDYTGVRVHGGNVNSKSTKSGTPASCDSIVTDGSVANLDVVGGAVISAGTIDYAPGTITADGGVLEGFTTPLLPTLPEPDCSHLEAAGAKYFHKGDTVLEPGWYPNGIKITGESVTMRPGMYCLDGGSNGGLILTKGDLGAMGVFIVVREGSVQLGGSGKLGLAAAKSIYDGAGEQWGGMLFYMPYENEGQIHLTGGATAIYHGTIYAPGPPHSGEKCVIGGTADLTSLNSSIYCYTLKIGGNGQVVVDYVEGQNYQMSGAIELSQ